MRHDHKPERIKERIIGLTIGAVAVVFSLFPTKSEAQSQAPFYKYYLLTITIRDKSTYILSSERGDLRSIDSTVLPSYNSITQIFNTLAALGLEYVNVISTKSFTDLTNTEKEYMVWRRRIL
jgi:hypothetical protein